MSSQWVVAAPYQQAGPGDEQCRLRPPAGAGGAGGALQAVQKAAVA